jgi:two-component system, chemotaxis family, protein-glutamate methylesterase/glutaminase
MSNIRVLVIDDSPLARGLLGEIITQTPGMEVAGYARDGVAGAAELTRLQPDLVTLDLEMPRMGGIHFLETVLPLHPTPVVVVSSIAKEGQKITLQALALGAVDFVTKPTTTTATGFEDYAALVRAKLLAAAQINRTVLREMLRPHAAQAALGLTQPLVPLVKQTPREAPPQGIIAIGASAGGPVALKRMLEGLPADSPPVLIAQHMPAHFTGAFAQRLDAHCAMHVVEASDGDRPKSGVAYVAPGDAHLRLVQDRDGWKLQVTPGPAVRQHRPSVDILFESVASVAGKRAIAIILTGMGDDGAAGIVAIKKHGGFAIAQDASSSAIYGMPRAAAATGLLDVVVPLESVATACGAAVARWKSVPNAVRA